MAPYDRLTPGNQNNIDEQEEQVEEEEDTQSDSPEEDFVDRYGPDQSDSSTDKEEETVDTGGGSSSPEEDFVDDYGPGGSGPDFDDDSSDGGSSSSPEEDFVDEYNSDTSSESESGEKTEAQKVLTGDKRQNISSESQAERFKENFSEVDKKLYNESFQSVKGLEQSFEREEKLQESLEAIESSGKNATFKVGSQTVTKNEAENITENLIRRNRNNQNRLQDSLRQSDPIGVEGNRVDSIGDQITKAGGDLAVGSQRKAEEFAENYNDPFFSRLSEGEGDPEAIDTAQQAVIQGPGTAAGSLIAGGGGFLDSPVDFVTEDVFKGGGMFASDVKEDPVKTIGTEALEEVGEAAVTGALTGGAGVAASLGPSIDPSVTPSLTGDGSLSVSDVLTSKSKGTVAIPNTPESTQGPATTPGPGNSPTTPETPESETTPDSDTFNLETETRTSSALKASASPEIGTESLESNASEVLSESPSRPESDVITEARPQSQAETQSEVLAESTARAEAQARAESNVLTDTKVEVENTPQLESQLQPETTTPSIDLTGDDNNGDEDSVLIPGDKKTEYRGSVGAEVLGITSEEAPSRSRAQNPLNLRPVVEGKKKDEANLL